MPAARQSVAASSDRLELALKTVDEAITVSSNRADKVIENSEAAILAAGANEEERLSVVVRKRISDATTDIERHAQQEIANIVSKTLDRIEGTTFESISTRRLAVIDKSGDEGIVMQERNSRNKVGSLVAIDMRGPGQKTHLVLSASDKGTALLLNDRAAILANSDGDSAVMFSDKDILENPEPRVSLGFHAKSEASHLTFGQDGEVGAQLANAGKKSTLSFMRNGKAQTQLYDDGKTAKLMLFSEGSNGLVAEARDGFSQFAIQSEDRAMASFQSTSSGSALSLAGSAGDPRLVCKVSEGYAGTATVSATGKTRTINGTCSCGTSIATLLNRNGQIVYSAEANDKNYVSVYKNSSGASSLWSAISTYSTLRGLGRK